MTTEQKQRLAAYVAWHKPKRFNGDTLYFLTEGEIISFTNCEYTAQNAQYEIDNIPNRKIWFSQLSKFYFSDDFDSIYQPIIKFKYGTSYVISESFDESTFFNKVKNKKFKVDIITAAPYILNKQSDIWDQKNIYTYKDAYDYIKRCLSFDRIDEIGDLLKTSKAYFFTEVQYYYNENESTRLYISHLQRYRRRCRFYWQWFLCRRYVPNRRSCSYS